MTPLVVAAAPGRSPAVWGAMLGYLAIVAAIGWWATRRTRTARDFFVAGQRLGVFPMAMAAMAASLSGFAFIGGPGLVYRFGIGAVYIVLPLAITSTMTAWVLARQLRSLGEGRGCFTIPDAIGARYGSRAARGLAAVALLIAVVGYLATNFLALGLVLDAVLGTGLAAGIWLGMLVTLAYSVSGGILAGVYTDVFQGVVMAVASLLVFVAAQQAGGDIGLARTIMPADPAFLSPFGTLGPLPALSFFFVFGIGVLGQPHVVHKFYMLRDPARLRWYPAVMSAAMLLGLLLFVGVGIAVKALVVEGRVPAPASPDDVTPVFLAWQGSPLLAGLVYAGVAAAIMSSVNSFLSVGAAALMHDLPVALGRETGDILHRGRWSTGLLALLGALVAVTSESAVAFLGIFGWGLFASTLVPALAIGLNWARGTRAGAIASIATGLVVTLVLETLAWLKAFTFPAGVTATALALVASLLVYVGVSLVTRDELDPDIRRIVEGAG